MEAQMQTSITGIVSEGLKVVPASYVSDGPTHRPLIAWDGARPATDILDRTYDGLLGPDVHTAMNRLRASLSALRRRLPADEWEAFGRDARRHPVHSLLLESPFTRRAYSKPRGYAGDAVLMDLIYGKARPPVDLSALGGLLYGYEFDSPCFQSVRTRRAIVAREIDDVASPPRQARVLSLASGHLRELEWSRAARSGAVSITAIDQDRESLEIVSQQYHASGVVTVPASVGDVLRRSVRFSDVDLAYAAGLYDYLPDDLARSLNATLFRTLRSGGRLLIANFTPAADDAAFMEAFMDWRLIYRTAEHVRALADRIPIRDVAALEQFSDPNQHITYLRVTRR
jgi:extracellular factor (EF) 3-hydroxypalmitic acid methyl ester biosynthesis protein